jgi:GntR family transcriptional regulator
MCVRFSCSQQWATLPGKVGLTSRGAQLANVDPTDPRPSYRQIADRLRERILGGEFAPGDPLPSESELVAEFGVSRPTVRSALSLLKNEGRIHARQGRGVFVRAQKQRLRRSSDRYSQQNREPGRTPLVADTAAVEPPQVELLRFAPQPASSAIAGRLALAEDSLVLVTALRLHTSEGVVQTSTAYLPYELAKDSPAADPGQQPWLIDTIANLARIGVHVDRVHEEVIARIPIPQEATELRLRSGQHVFEIARTMFANGAPVEACDLVMPVDRYVLAYDVAIE